MKAFGFETTSIDGNCIPAIYDALEMTKGGGNKPYAIILNTIKGKGIPEVENALSNHSMNVGKEQCDRWLKELEKELKALDPSFQSSLDGVKSMPGKRKI